MRIVLGVNNLFNINLYLTNSETSMGYEDVRIRNSSASSRPPRSRHKLDFLSFMFRLGNNIWSSCVSLIGVMKTRLLGRQLS